MRSPTVAHALRAENLIDDYWLFITSHVFSSGVVCLCYERKGDD